MKIVDLEKETAAKRVELSLLLSQRDEIMRSLSTGGASLTSFFFNFLIFY